jgi:hypothetical protein
MDNCDGAFEGSVAHPVCTNFFKGCECVATQVSGDLRSESGPASRALTPSKNTCGNPQDCGLNGCNGAFNLNNGKAFCTNNLWVIPSRPPYLGHSAIDSKANTRVSVGCQCAANQGTCGNPQSCDQDNCAGKFSGNVPTATCSNFFKGCPCTATSVSLLLTRMGALSLRLTV